MTGMSTSSPSVDQLRHAIEIAEKIQSLEAELASILGGSAVVSAPSARAVAAAPVAPSASAAPKTRGRKKGQKLSAETKAKMAAAQQARHAKKNGSAVAAAPAPKAGKKKGGKRTLSPEALERIREGQRKRWAKVK